MNVRVCKIIYLCGYNHFLIQTASLFHIAGLKLPM